MEECETPTKIITDGSGKGHSVALFPKNEKYFTYQKGATSNEAEYNGIIVALNYLPENSKAIIQTDSRLVVGQLSKGWRINYAHLYRKVVKIKKLISSKNLDVEFKWIPRGRNTADRALKRHLKQLDEENRRLRKKIGKNKGS